jgi:hypothetical protein
VAWTLWGQAFKTHKQKIPLASNIPFYLFPKLFLPLVLVNILKKYTNLLARDLNFINKIRGKRVYLKPMEFFACEF